MYNQKNELHIKLLNSARAVENMVCVVLQSARYSVGVFDGHHLHAVVARAILDDELCCDIISNVGWECPLAFRHNEMAKTLLAILFQPTYGLRAFND